MEANWTAQDFRNAGDYEKCRAMEAAHGMNLIDRTEIGA